MQSSTDRVLEQFTDLHHCIKETFDEMHRQTQERWRQFTTSVNIHFILSVFGAFFAWPLIIGSFSPQFVKAFINENLFTTISSFLPLLQWIGFAGWIILIAAISAFVNRKTINRRIVLLIYSIALLPMIPCCLLLTFTLGGVISPQSVLATYLVYILVSFIIWLLIFGALQMFIFPLILFSLLTSTSANRKASTSLLPGYLDIVRSATQKVEHNPAFARLTTNQWEAIEAITRWKFDGINGRVQAFSFGIGALGLLSILTLVLSENELRTLWEGLWNGILRLMGGETWENTNSSIATLLLLGIIILLSLRYFARSYIELRILEAIGIICALTKQNNRAEHSATPAAIAHSTTEESTLPPPQTATKSDPAISADNHAGQSGETPTVSTPSPEGSDQRNDATAS